MNPFLLILLGLLLVVIIFGNRPIRPSQTPPSQESIFSVNVPPDRAPRNPLREITLLVGEDKDNSSRLSDQEKNLIIQYTRETGSEPVWLTYRSPEELEQLLEEKPGAIVLTAGRPAREITRVKLKYTAPWGMSREQVVVRDDTTSMKGLYDLTTRQVYVKPSSPALPILRAMEASYTGMDLQIIPETMDTETVLKRVSSGLYDVVVLDSLTLDVNLKEFLDLEVAFSLTDDQSLSWGVMDGDDDLQATLDKFLNKRHLTLNPAEVYREDLYALKDRKKLRLITIPGSTTYFFNDGHLAGFEYEFIKRFARDNGMRLDVVIARSQDEMADLLLDGRGDVIAASVTLARAANDRRIRTTEAYNSSAPVVIGRVHDYPLLDIRDLEGRRIFLAEDSPYRFVLEHIHKRGINFDIVTTARGMNSYGILSQVARGEYDLTVIGSHRINTDLRMHENLKMHFSLDEPLPHSLIVRDSDKQLLTALNNYISREYRKAFYNVLYAKYIARPISKFYPEQGLAAVNRLSPYDEIVHEYADMYGFDWRLIVAQMYMESQFNPDAVSYAGARGLMQLLPETADLLGIDDLSDPDRNIYGGIRYLDYLRKRFEETLAPEDRTWFTLAAYNAGYNRVKRARNLAANMGLDADRWFDHVEKAMLMLSVPYKQDGELVRYCRCGQTANYVREIKILYNNYARLIHPQTVKDRDGS